MNENALEGDVPCDRIVAETDGTGAAGTKREYIWLGDMPVAVIDKTVTPNKTYMVHADHLNRPQFMTDSTRAQVWKAIYEPFGTVYSTTGTAAQTLRFPGQWFQIESGLAYNWHRHYDATIGRYVSADPLGLYDGASVFGYVRQAPLELSDPEGRFVPILVGAAVRGAVMGALSSGVLDFALQVALNGGSIVCIDKKQLAISAGIGAIGGGLFARFREAARIGNEIGILRDAATGKGNFGLGSAAAQDAARLGEAWVGAGYKIASDGKTLLSADGLRQFRPASFKGRRGTTQANFERRFQADGRWQGNGHLDIKP